jgi:predicted transcriptional regulator
MTARSTQPDVIEELRAVVPRRGLSPAEARRVAELQAAKLLQAAGIVSPPVPEAVIADLPGLRISRRSNWPTSGLATTTKAGWVIVVRAEEAAVRQRFSVAHEFKHVLDDPFIEWLYPTIRERSPEDRAEDICNHFAACVLMPKGWIKRDWGEGIQQIDRLARRYDVSRQAMGWRVEQLRLRMPPPRCAGIRRTGVTA